MYTENVGKDVYRFTKALVTNQVARWAPKLYKNLTHYTGRGDGSANASQTVDYFFRCFSDYREQLNYQDDQFKEFLKGKTILEYGPGDILGVSLLMYAHGAASVHCVDRFNLEKVSEHNIQTYKEIVRRLSPKERDRAGYAFNVYGDPASGFNQNVMRYFVAKDGLLHETDAYDLIISRSVLEHVNRLEMTINDMARALKADGIAVHKVDLKSHKQDRYRSFDFLTWPETLYRLMNSQKGRPNRWRVDKYKELVSRSGLRFRKLAHTGKLEDGEIDRIRLKLAKNFRNIPTEELTWLGFWMVLERAR